MGNFREVARWTGRLIWRIGRESMGRIRCGVVWCGQGRSSGGVYIKCTISDRPGN